MSSAFAAATIVALFAQQGTAATAAITIVAPAAEVQALTPVLRDLLGRRRVDATVVQRASFSPGEVLATHAAAAGVVARAWIDLSRPGRADIYLADPRAERFVLRSLTLARGLDEIGRESVGLVVASGVHALVEDRDSALSRAQAESMLAARAAPPTPPPPVGSAPPPVFQVACAYGAELLTARFGPMHGPGASLAVARAGWSVWTAADLRLSRSFDTAPIAAELSGLWLRGGVAREWSSSSRWVRLAVGGGADRVSVRGRSGSAAVAARAALWSPAARVELAAGHAVAGLSLFASARADAELGRTHYDVEAAGQRRAVLRPWPVRPSVHLGVAWR